MFLRHGRMHNLLDSLDTAVRLELLARALPVQGALDNLVDDADDIVDLADELRGGVAFAQRDGAILECWG